MKQKYGIMLVARSTHINLWAKDGPQRNGDYMALTRKMLKAMGIEDDKIDEIIEAHTDTVDALKNERDSFKSDSEQLSKVVGELEELKKATANDEFKNRYEEEHRLFEDYKAKMAEEKANNEKVNLFKSLLQSVGVDSKRFDSIVRVSDMSKIEVKDGKIVDNDSIVESIKKDWSDFIVSNKSNGASVDNPPSNGGSDDLDKLSDVDYYKKVYERKN